VHDVERMLVATEGDQDLAEQKLIQAVKWRKSTLEGWQSAVTKQRLARILGMGRNGPVVYACAAYQKPGDCFPVITARLWDQAIRTSSDPLAKMDYVVDAHGFQPLLNLNVTPFLRLASALDSYFAERFVSITVVDMPLAARWIWRAVKPLLAPKTRKKIKFISRSDTKEMESLCCDLGVDQDMRDTIAQLFVLAKESTNKDRRRRQSMSQPFNDHVDSFLSRQRQAEKARDR
jgi:hypothetical protein